MSQKVYRAQLIPDHLQLTPVAPNGTDAGQPLTIELDWREGPAQVPHALLKKLGSIGERFVGSLPGTDGHYYVITEPSETLPKEEPLGAETMLPGDEIV